MVEIPRPDPTCPELVSGTSFGDLSGEVDFASWRAGEDGYGSLQSVFVIGFTVIRRYRFELSLPVRQAGGLSGLGTAFHYFTDVVVKWRYCFVSEVHLV
ncbi:MAG: hypothetical protein R6V32_08235 [Bacteroidales bacterium]